MTSDCALSFCPEPAIVRVKWVSAAGTLSSCACLEHLPYVLERSTEGAPAGSHLELEELSPEALMTIYRAIDRLVTGGGSLP